MADPSPWQRPLLCVAVMLLVLAGGWWAAPTLQSLRAAAAVGTLPLRGSIDLFVWNSDDADRQGASLADPQALPLREGDRVRLSVELNRPAYVYVVWLDVDGCWSPVFPWRQGQWTAPTPHDLPRAMVGLPEASGVGWPVRRAPQAGMETLVLLARATPLPAEVRVDELLNELPRVPIPARPHALWFQEGRLQSVDQRGDTREPELKRLVPIDDDLVRLQRQLVEKLQPHFELIRAVSFPVRGE